MTTVTVPNLHKTAEGINQIPMYQQILQIFVGAYYKFGIHWQAKKQNKTKQKNKQKLPTIIYAYVSYEILRNLVAFVTLDVGSCLYFSPAVMHNYF